MPMWVVSPVERFAATVGMSSEAVVVDPVALLVSLKKRKLRFGFAKTKRSSNVPAIYGKRLNPRWQSLVARFGEPEHDSRDGEPAINGYGMAVFPSGEKFVIDAKSGEIIERTERVRYIGISRGMHFYIHEDNELLIGDHAIPSFPRI